MYTIMSCFLFSTSCGEQKRGRFSSGRFNYLLCTFRLKKIYGNRAKKLTYFCSDRFGVYLCIFYENCFPRYSIIHIFVLGKMYSNKNWIETGSIYFSHLFYLKKKAWICLGINFNYTKAQRYLPGIHPNSRNLLVTQSYQVVYLGIVQEHTSTKFPLIYLSTYPNMKVSCWFSRSPFHCNVCTPWREGHISFFLRLFAYWNRKQISRWEQEQKYT